MPCEFSARVTWNQNKAQETQGSRSLEERRSIKERMVAGDSGLAKTFPAQGSLLLSNFDQ